MLKGELVKCPLHNSRFNVRTGEVLTSVQTSKTIASYALGARFERVGAWIDPISKVVLAAIVAWYAWRVIRGSRRNASP